MTQYSISIELDSNTLKYVNLIQQNLKKNFGVRRMMEENSPPHVNLVSGSPTDLEELISFVKRQRLKKNIILSNLGLGMLFTPAPLLYVRFSRNLLIENFRNNLLSKENRLWLEVSSTVEFENWIPKSSIAYKDIEFCDIGKIIPSILRFRVPPEMCIKKLLLIEVGEAEKIVQKFII